jgi:hypothetical protein
MPILGVIASQISGRLFAPSGAYDSIASFTISGDSTTEVNFTSIPSTYKHLQLRISGRSRANASVFSYSVQIPSVNGNIHYMAGDGSSVYTDYNGPLSYPFNFSLPGSDATANAFGSAIIDILDYTDTNKNRVLRSFSGMDLNGSGVVRLNSTWYTTQAAITALTVQAYNGGIAWAADSKISLYGIKG